MDVKCKKCQGHYLLRQGKYGLFAGCSNFPRCRSTMKLAEFLKASGQTEASFFPKPSQELPTRYVAFDVESPNKANDRMSAIGVAVVEDGGIVEEFYTTVDPEVHFDPFNIQLTGLSEAVVAGSPTFPELWPTLEPLLSSGLLIAHNAPFDMSVLAKCLRDYTSPGGASPLTPAPSRWAAAATRSSPATSSAPYVTTATSPWTTTTPAATAGAAPCSCWTTWPTALICGTSCGNMTW